MSWVQGMDVMRLQRYAEGITIWATGRRWGRSQARLGREVWIVSGGQIGLGNEDESRTDLYLKILARAVTCRGKEKRRGDNGLGHVHDVNRLRSLETAMDSSPSIMH